jgi:hypothetical protein
MKRPVLPIYNYDQIYSSALADRWRQFYRSGFVYNKYSVQLTCGDINSQLMEDLTHDRNLIYTSAITLHADSESFVTAGANTSVHRL